MVKEIIIGFDPQDIRWYHRSCQCLSKFGIASLVNTTSRTHLLLRRYIYLGVIWTKRHDCGWHHLGEIRISPEKKKTGKTHGMFHWHTAIPCKSSLVAYVGICSPMVTWGSSIFRKSHRDPRSDLTWFKHHFLGDAGLVIKEVPLCYYLFL